MADCTTHVTSQHYTSSCTDSPVPGARAAELLTARRFAKAGYSTVTRNVARQVRTYRPQPQNSQCSGHIRVHCQQCPDRSWGPCVLLFSGQRKPLQRRSSRGVKITSHPHVVRRLRISGTLPVFMHMPSECTQ